MSTTFERELKNYRSEVTSVTFYFYTYLAVHAVAAQHRPVRELYNKAPSFWNTLTSSLQMSAFIVLGRIFDKKSAHNVGKLLRIAQDNPQIFSKEALSRRKQGKSPNPPEWLAKYLRDVYEPNVKDFRRLWSHVNKWRKIYESNYRDLRHKLFAHKEVFDQADVDKLFAKTNTRELQKMLAFLGSLHDALWELFINGNKPVLRPRRYSVKRMRERPLPKGWARTDQEHIIQECEKFLLTIAGITGKKDVRKSQ